MQHIISFRPLALSDVPLMLMWFNLPHVQKFYSLRQWTEKEVLEKLEPYISGAKPVSGYIVLLNDTPIGYVQQYKIRDYPWPNLHLADDVINHASGMDLFIGDKSLIGKGIGRQIVQTFIEQKVWPEFQYCIVDPDVSNDAAIRCYEGLNFTEHSVFVTENALGRSTTLKLMMLTRPNQLPSQSHR